MKALVVDEELGHRFWNIIDADGRIAYVEFYSDVDVTDCVLDRLARQFAASDLMVEACKGAEAYHTHICTCAKCIRSEPCGEKTDLFRVAQYQRRAALAAVEGDE